MYSLKAQCWIVSAQMVALIIVFLPPSTSVVVPGSISTLNSSSNFLSQPLNVTLREGDTYQLILMVNTCAVDIWIELGEHCRFSHRDGESDCQLDVRRHNELVCNEAHDNNDSEIHIFEINIVVDKQFMGLFDNQNQNLRVSFGHTGANSSRANIRYVSDVTVPPECDTTTPTLPVPQCNCASVDVDGNYSNLLQNMNCSSSLGLGNMLLSTWIVSFSVFFSVVLTLSL